MSDVSRRDVLRTIATGAGAASALWVDSVRGLADAYASSVRLPMPQGARWTPVVLSPHQLATVGVLVDLIIPATETPGARAAQVDRYIDGVLSTAEAPVRDRVLEGLAWLDARSQTLFGSSFISASTAEQTELLSRLAAEDAAAREPAAGVEFFTAAKALTIAGYYSSEIGLRQELGDDGRMMLATFEGCTHPEHMR